MHFSFEPGMTGAARAPIFVYLQNNSESQEVVKPMTPSGDGGGAVQGAPGGAAPKTAQQDGGGGFPGMMMLPLVIMFALMYFLVMRPEKKRQKEAQSMRSNLKKGDRVLLTGGMLGDVAGMGDDWITVEIADKVRVQFQRSAVVSIIEARSTSDASVASSK